MSYEHPVGVQKPTLKAQGHFASAGLGDPRRRQTDFLHWTGVAAMVATALLSLVFRWVVF